VVLAFSPPPYSIFLPPLFLCATILLKGGFSMDSITVKVSDIFEVINQIHSDGMDKVTLSFIEADDDLPAAISLVASKDNDKVEIDYEEIESC
jgi:hypothetical protein